MCWSYEVSMASFVIGVSVGSYLLCRNRNYDKVLGNLILFYSFIQLWEAQMWTAVNTNNAFMNLKYTKLIYLTLWIQALAVGLGIYQITKDRTMLVIGLLLFLYGFCTMPTFTLSAPNEGNHLLWGFNSDYYAYVVLAMMVGCLKYTDLKFTWLAFVFFFTPYLYLRMNKTATLSSLWCWFAAMFSFVAVWI